MAEKTLENRENSASEPAAPPKDPIDYNLKDDDIRDVVEALHAQDADTLYTALEDLSSADTAELLAKIKEDEREELLSKFGDVLDPETFVELDTEISKSTLSAMSAAQVAEIISDLESDDALLLIEPLEPDFQKEIMKKLIYIFVLTLGIISCSSDNESQISNSDLVGEWNWIGTSGGLIYFEETPETTGKEIHLTLTDNYHFSITENGNEISNGTYELTLKNSIYSGEMERFIKLLTIDQQYVGFVKNGIINVHEKERLEISDNNYDGIGSGFIKIK